MFEAFGSVGQATRDLSGQTCLVSIGTISVVRCHNSVFCSVLFAFPSYPFGQADLMSPTAANPFPQGFSTHQQWFAHMFAKGLVDPLLHSPPQVCGALESKVQLLYLEFLASLVHCHSRTRSDRAENGHVVHWW